MMMEMKMSWLLCCQQSWGRHEQKQKGPRGLPSIGQEVDKPPSQLGISLAARCSIVGSWHAASPRAACRSVKLDWLFRRAYLTAA